jgi:hypothetical protein
MGWNVTLLGTSWRTYWKLVENINVNHWEPTQIRAPKSKQSWTSHPHPSLPSPHLTPKGKKNYSLGCILSCLIGYVKILFPKTFCHHFWLELMPLPKRVGCIVWLILISSWVHSQPFLFFSWSNYIDRLIIDVLWALGTLWATNCKIETNCALLWLTFSVYIHES